MNTAELEAVAKASLAAAVAGDVTRLNEAMEPMFEPGVTRGDGLAWVLWMVHIAVGSEKAAQRHPGAMAVPRVARVDPRTGAAVIANIEDAPAAVSAYSRISAAWLNEDADTACDVWNALVDRSDEQLPLCMSIAVSLAAAAYRQRLAAQQ